MNFNKCSRCGSFFVSEGDICPKCRTKDTFEFNTFKGYIEENGFNSSLHVISGETGISLKNLNRFLGYEGMEEYKGNFENNTIGKNTGNSNLGVDIFG